MLRSISLIVWFPFLGYSFTLLGPPEYAAELLTSAYSGAFWEGVVGHASAGAWPFEADILWGAGMPFGLGAPWGRDEVGLNCAGVLVKGGERTEWPTLVGALYGSKGVPEYCEC